MSSRAAGEGAWAEVRGGRDGARAPAQRRVCGHSLPGPTLPALRQGDHATPRPGLRWAGWSTRPSAITQESCPGHCPPPASPVPVPLSPRHVSQGFSLKDKETAVQRVRPREATCRALGSHQEARRKRNLPQKTVAPTVHPPPRHSSPSPAGPTWGCWSPNQLFPCCPSPGGQLPCEWGHPPFQRHPGTCLQPRPLGEQRPAWLAHWGQRIPRGGSLTSPTPAPSAPPEAPCAASASARAPRGSGSRRAGRLRGPPP